MNNKYTNTFRLHQWWQPKAGNILTIIFLACILIDLDFTKLLIFILPSVITIVGIGSFGHLINDLFDLEIDKKAGKKNALQNKSNFVRFLLLSFTFIIALLPWLILPYNYLSIYLLVTEFVLLIVYASPPIRLKTKGFLAIISDALYAHVIPSILAFHTFVLLSGKIIPKEIYITIAIWQFFVGIHNILIHHLEDYKNDSFSNIKTFAISIGKEKTRKLILNIIFPLHLISFMGLLIVISKNYYWFYAIFPLLYLAVYFYNTFSNKSFTLFLQSNNVNDLQKINIHYHHFFIYWQLFLLFFIDFKYGFILVFILIILNNTPFKWFIHNSLNFILKYFNLKKILSFLINYCIYYFRRFILFESPQKARREHYEAFESVQQEKNKRINKVNIAIVNKNLKKYTETFIDSRKNALPYYIHTIYGNDIPDKSDKKSHLITGNNVFQKFIDWKELFFDKEENYYAKIAFKDYLINNNISIVLAEFGTTGVEIYKLCKEAGVPMLVTFYGYDAFHKEILEKHLTQYQEMFEYSSKIICVSKDIQNQLISLGANSDKTKYLPCTFFPENFAFTNHSNNKNIFLAIGRFAETKSPHLTILAFKEVLKEIPDAQLVMIGKDGGGELFEACHILVKALKIEKQVDFKGILTPQEVKAEMDKAKVFVQHSLTTPINRDKEGTPVAIMEAMANGLAIVATKHAGIQEMIENNVSGILVEEYDYIQMSKEMIEVCKNAILNKKLGENAAKSIRNNPLITDNIKILTEIIEKHRLK